MGKAKKQKAAGAGKFGKALEREEKEMVEKFDKFVDAWKTHVHEEINIHKKLLEGKQNFKKHLADTVGIHKKFIKKLSKL